MARVKHNATTRPPLAIKPDFKPRKPLAVMSTRPLHVETPSPENDKGSTSSSAPPWGEDPWAGMDPGPKSQKQGSKLIDYCDKPGQFWPDGQEPAFKGQKSRRREINRLKEDARQTQSFHPRTGDIELYHDYSDYEGSFDDEEDFFESLDDEHDVIPPAAVAPIPPPEVTPVPPPTLLTSPNKFPTSQTAAPPTTVTPTDASPPDGPAHESVVALSEEQRNENKQSLIKRFRDKQNGRVAEAARLKQEKEMHAHEEKEKLTALERERAEQARLEQEHVEQKCIEQERLEQVRLEQARIKQERTEQARLEQERVEQKRIKQERLEQVRLEQARIKQECTPPPSQLLCVRSRCNFG
ncbi:uncharacterized protein BJ212DRAFT_1486191 [Suillus subaureus]|uniref:Uncharacterized protein n=1 Tax=Suillus subaureus TaxID=48587 RepID=A0A9P7DXN3_9AGAM|nr:uncharacterized protein BJ212DRAFT_1486191 [Suillus subaureus]KAG1805851.1 hypothetical protein BJ212DRAFT_1486191 [Suillus subaureus]